MMQATRFATRTIAPVVAVTSAIFTVSTQVAAQVCESVDNGPILAVGDDINGVTVSGIDSAVMRTDGVALMIVADATGQATIRHLLRRNVDGTFDLLLSTGPAPASFTKLSNAQINDAGDIIFVGDGPDGLNVYQLAPASAPLLDFDGDEPNAIGRPTLRPDQLEFVVSYTTLDFGRDGIEITSCLDRHPDGLSDNCDAEALFIGPAINANGDFAFLRLNDDGSRNLITNDGTVVASTSPAGTLSAPSINDAGDIAYFAFDPDPKNSLAAGIYVWDGTPQDTPVVDYELNGLAAPEIARQPWINAAGRVAFIAVPDAQNNPSNKAIFFVDDNGELHPLDEDEFDLADGDRVILGFVYDDEGESTDRLLFRAPDTNRVAGLYLTACDFSPEPIDEAFCPADLSGNGSVGVADLLALLSDWGDCVSCANCPSDLTGSCSVGVADLLILLGNWGDCPTRACCLPNGDCEELSFFECTEVEGGTFFADIEDCNDPEMPECPDRLNT